MHHKLLDKHNRHEITQLFRSVFTASEGEPEGRLVGHLASKLSSNIDNEDIICVGAYQDEELMGSIFCTRLWFDEPIMVYMVAPVAVGTEHQGKGVGQSLINFGLRELKTRCVEIAITYGDPSFYARVGFEPLSERVIQAPLKLSMPAGWLGLSLTGEPVPTINACPTCVSEFDDPVYW